jgi:putative sigma-54 modulation protein
MQLNLTGHHLEITPALRTYVTEKFSRLTRHFEQMLDVHCVLRVEKLRHRAEAKLNVTGSTIFADSAEDDMYAAIDSLVDKLDRQIKKHKEKIQNKHPRHAEPREPREP